MPLSDDDVWLR